MKTIGLLFILMLGLLSGCKKETEAGSNIPDEEIKLKAGAIYQKSSDNLSVKVTKITDSRCPVGVVCVWQGEATVYLEVKESTTWEVVLSTLRNPSDTVKNYIFKLIDVLPYPRYKVEVPESEKVVVLQIDKL